jgi:hypothetical protein
VLQFEVLLLERPLEPLALGDVPGRGEDALQAAVPVVEGGRVVGHDRLGAVLRPDGELVVAHLVLGEHALDGLVGPARIGEEVLARGADQFLPGAAGQRDHLLVDVADDALGVGRHEGVDIRFDQRAGVELLVPQLLVEQGLGRLHQFPRRVVGPDQQVADDLVVGVPQRGDRDDRREPAPVLADVGQLVDVLDAARGLEHQGLEAGGDRGVQFGTQLGGPGDELLRVGDVRRGDLVDHVGGGVPEHPFGTDVEDLDDAELVRGDAGEVGAVEDRFLQRPGLDRSGGEVLGDCHLTDPPCSTGVFQGFSAVR